jgi:hypothetical protein
MTGENLALAEAARPFLEHQAVDVLQPDLMNAGGITGTKLIADLAGLYRIPVCLHNVSGYALNLASQQFSAGVFNCPMMECRRDADRAPEAAANVPVIRDGRMRVSDAPGLGIELDLGYLNAHRAEGEPAWTPDRAGAPGPAPHAGGLHSGPRSAIASTRLPVRRRRTLPVAPASNRRPRARPRRRCGGVYL